MCLLDLFREMGEGFRVVEMTCTCLGSFLFGGSNAEKWGDHRKKNFFTNNSVGLSLCESPIETVEYICVNISCIFDWILLQKNCRNTLPLHTFDQLARIVMLLCKQPIGCKQLRLRCLSDGRIKKFRFGCDFALFEQFSIQQLRSIFTNICIA